MIYTITVLILKLKILIYKSLNYKLFNKVILHGIPKIVYPQRVSIGSSTRINPRVFLQAAGGVIIGKNVTLSYGVTILSTGYCLKNWSTNKYLKEHEDIPIYISDDVWVGANVTILSGVTISLNYLETMDLQ